MWYRRAAKVTTYIWGSGGLGHEIYWYLRDDLLAGSDVAELHPDRIAFIDDDPDLDSACLPAQFAGLPGQVTFEADDDLVIAIGDAGERADIAKRVKDLGLPFRTIVHPSAWVAPNATIGAGAIITPLVFVAANSIIGSNVLLNTHANVGHDAIVGDNSVLSPHAVINGNVELGEAVFMGTSATITPSVKVGDRCIIGASSLIRKDLARETFAVGNPVRISPIK